MITWAEAIINGIKAFQEREKYAYFYGAKGQVLDTRTMEALWSAEPGYFSRYSKQEKEQIFANSYMRIGLDCSGFTGWVCTGDKTYSTGQFGHRTSATQNLAQGVAGSLLYTTYGNTGRHIGIDIGGGAYLHCVAEATEKNIKLGKDGVQMWFLNDNRIPWEWSFKSGKVDYSGAEIATSEVSSANVQLYRMYKAAMKIM